MQGVTTCYQHLSSSCKETVKPWKLRVHRSRIGFERFPSHITISACNLQTCWKNSFWKDEKALNRSCSRIESQDRSNARPQNCSWSRCYRASMPYVDAHAMPFLDGMEGMETGYAEGWWVDKQLDGCRSWSWMRRVSHRTVFFIWHAGSFSSYWSTCFPLVICHLSVLCLEMWMTKIMIRQ